jgi:hypothetical protein
MQALAPSVEYGNIEMSPQPINCIVLQTNSGEHLGFVISYLDGESPTGDCVFQVFPAESHLWESPIVDDLWHRKELGESRIGIRSREPYEVIISSSGLPDLFATWRDGVKGTWGTDANGARQILGIAFPCKP